MTLKQYKEMKGLSYPDLAEKCGASVGILNKHILKGHPIGARLALRIQKSLRNAVTLQELTIDPIKKIRKETKCQPL